jgi:hypothetical protein
LQNFFPVADGVHTHGLEIVLKFVGQLEVELHSFPALRDWILEPHFPNSSLPDKMASLAKPDLHRKLLKIESSTSTSIEKLEKNSKNKLVYWFHLQD